MKNKSFLFIVTLMLTLTQIGYSSNSFFSNSNFDKNLAVPDPTVASFSPTSGTTGTTITITGTNLASGTSSVTIGGVAVTSFTVVNSTTITAIVGCGSSGNIVVSRSNGQFGTSSSIFTFSVNNSISISSFTPASNGTSGTVSIFGTGFTGATVVKFGGTNATSFNVVSCARIDAVVGSGASGTIQVTSPLGTATSSSSFTYVLAPIISSFTPNSAATGNTVVISGTNFTNTTSVKFGATNASSFVVDNNSQITAVIASGTTGTISVTTAGGTATSSGSFTFISPPTITSFTPTSSAAGAIVTINGTDFSNTSAVSFGGTAAASYSVISSTQINATVASGTSGSISVTTPGGTTTKAGFTYLPPPTITSFTPTFGGQGSNVVITGTNFNSVLSVTFGGTTATSFVRNSATKITAIVSTGTTGIITITTTGGSVSSTGTFTFIPAPTITSFTNSTAATGASVVITGTNFTGLTSVTFGGTNATSFTVDSDTQISAVVGNGSSGLVSVTTLGGVGTKSGFIFIPNTQIQSSFNNTTLATMTTPINVDAVSGVEAYTYKVVNGGFSYEKERTGTNMGYFNFSQIPGTTFGTTYTVSVKAKINGVYGNYGSSVSITTPSVTALTKLNPANCGATLTTLGQRIYATPVTGATSYRFEVTSNGNTTTYDTAAYYFTLANVGGGQYGQSYSVRVATLLNGTYGSFGDACTVTAPIPTTKVRSTQCGITLASLSTTIASDIVTDATYYMFEIIGGGVTREYESTTYTLKFNRVPGYASLNTTYAIRVKVKVNGTYGVYGTSCNVTTPATRDGEFDEEFTDFTVISYPNPFAGTFQLDLKSTSNNEVNVVVYDMVGKQIENRSFNALEVYNQEFGANYAAGVYNVLVSQNGTTKTVRVIKN